MRSRVITCLRITLATVILAGVNNTLHAAWDNPGESSVADVSLDFRDAAEERFASLAESVSQLEQSLGELQESYSELADSLEEEDYDYDTDSYEAYDPYIEPLTLRPGQLATSVTSYYSIQDFSNPIFLTDDSIADDRNRIREWNIAANLRFGVTKNVEGFVDIPFRFLNLEVSDPEEEFSDNDARLADIVAGCNGYLGTYYDTNWFASADVTFPTGDDPFNLSSFLNLIDSGFWIASGSLYFTKTFEDSDVEVFGGVAYAYYVPDDFEGVRVEKDESYSAWFGLSWYLDEHRWVRTEFMWDYQGNSIFDEIEQPGTSFEPISLRLSMGKDNPCGQTIEPFFQFGLNDDQNVLQMGVSIYRFYPRGWRRSRNARRS